jgi:chromosome segregation ATPase
MPDEDELALPDGAMPPGDKRQEAAGKIDHFFEENRPLSEQEKAERQIKKVFSKNEVRDFIMRLIDQMAGQGGCPHVKDIYSLREQLEQLRAAAARELEALEAQGRQEVDAARAELEARAAQARAEREAALQQAREAAAEDVRNRLAELLRQAEIERGAAQDAAERLKRAQEELEGLRKEIAGLRKLLDNPDARAKAVLLQRIAELEARVRELEIGLDFFDLEDEPDDAALQKRAEAIRKPLESKSPALAGAVGASAAAAAASAKKFAALREQMHQGKASIGVVVDAVREAQDFEAARARTEVAGRTVGQ